MAKPALPASLIREAVEARLGPVGDFEPLPGGLVSQTFAFRRGGEAFVVRVREGAAAYEKDAFVARTFARPGLPIPAVVAIGGLSDGLSFCISRRAAGASIHDLGDVAAPGVAEAVLGVLAEISRGEASDVAGWGLFDGAGRARWRTWRDYLLRFHADAESWIARLAGADAALARGALALVGPLAPAFDPERRLIHGDFGSGNIIANGDVVTAVIDWDLAAIGDPLYDVANLLFWNEARLAAVCDTLRRREAARRRTLVCYQLRIGVEEVRRTVTGGDGAVDLGWLIPRLGELLREADI